MAHDYSIQQNIPVTNHVYKFLLARCGADKIVATRSTFIGSAVLSLLSKKNDIRHASKKSYPKLFRVIIKEEQYLRNGVFLDYKSAQAFNELVDKMFREELFIHAMINKSQKNDKFLDSIRNFLMVYNITEDDIKFETLYRDFKRKKDDIQLSLNLAESA